MYLRSVQQIVKRSNKELWKIRKQGSHVPVILAERTEDICEEKFKGTATTSLRAGETHSDEITERDQKNSLHSQT